MHSAHKRQETAAQIANLQELVQRLQDQIDSQSSKLLLVDTLQHQVHTQAAKVFVLIS